MRRTPCQPLTPFTGLQTRAFALLLHSAAVALCLASLSSFAASVFAALLWVATLVLALRRCWGARYLKFFVLASCILAYNTFVGLMLAWSCATAGSPRGCI